MRKNAIGPNRLKKFLQKEYRDGYLDARVRGAIALQLQALRKVFSLTQRQMAEKTGKTQSTIARLENTDYGRLTVQTLLDIAKGLDVALIVKFSSYPEFMEKMSDLTDANLAVENIHMSAQRSEAASRINDSQLPALFRNQDRNNPAPAENMRLSLNSINRTRKLHSIGHATNVERRENNRMGLH